MPSKIDTTAPTVLGRVFERCTAAGIFDCSALLCSVLFCRTCGVFAFVMIRIVSCVLRVSVVAACLRIVLLFTVYGCLYLELCQSIHFLSSPPVSSFYVENHFSSLKIPSMHSSIVFYWHYSCFCFIIDILLQDTFDLIFRCEQD